MENIIEMLGNYGKLLSRIHKTIAKYAKLKVSLAEAGDNVYQLVELLNTVAKESASITETPLRDKILNWLADEQRTCDLAKSDFRLQLGQQLSKRFAAGGKNVRGQFPVLRVGLYTFKFDFEFGEACFFFGPEIELIEARIPLSGDIIYNKVNEFDEALRASPFDAIVFVQELNQAYKRLIRSGDKALGEKLPIMKVLVEYVLLKQSKKFFIDPRGVHFKGISRVDLSYDLFRLRQSSQNDSGIRLHVATFDATTDKANVLWIPDNDEGEGTHYSHISIDHERS